MPRAGGGVAGLLAACFRLPVAMDANHRRTVPGVLLSELSRVPLLALRRRPQHAGLLQQERDQLLGARREVLGAGPVDVGPRHRGLLDRVAEQQRDVHAGQACFAVGTEEPAPHKRRQRT